MNFIQYWKPVFIAILLIAVPFLIWDVIFTEIGVWGFNPKYYIGLKILNLPLEEVLFFICIPFASIFTHYALLFFFPKLFLSENVTRILSISLIIVSFIIIFFNTDKWYTFLNFLIFAFLLIFSLNKITILKSFFITFLVILIPFFIVNGLLTGSFIEDEVVWYNNNENLGIRIGTIPVEDIFYAFNMLYSTILLIERFKFRFTKF